MTTNHLKVGVQRTEILHILNIPQTMDKVKQFSLSQTCRKLIWLLLCCSALTEELGNCGTVSSATFASNRVNQTQ